MPALLGGKLALTEGVDETIRRLQVLVEVADTITQRLSLDHQLPRLIAKCLPGRAVGSADADNALSVATDMVRALGAFSGRRSERGFEPIEIGIGLAPGAVLAGSVGATKRMEYTAIGGNVNLAARLESANKYYGTVVLLAESTVDALKAPAVLRRLDLMQAISQPTWVSESLGHHTPAIFPRLGALIKAAYEAGLDCYQRRDWKGGLTRFGEALELALHDRPSRIFFRPLPLLSCKPAGRSLGRVWIMEQK
jgi:hypothetical protein